MAEARNPFTKSANASEVLASSISPVARAVSSSAKCVSPKSEGRRRARSERRKSRERAEATSGGSTCMSTTARLTSDGMEDVAAHECTRATLGSASHRLIFASREVSAANAAVCNVTTRKRSPSLHGASSAATALRIWSRVPRPADAASWYVFGRLARWQRHSVMALLARR
eukprot:scaffold271110_cov31-Tisochrysis_lutea.AAC.4